MEPAPWAAVVELEGTADSPDLPWYFIRFEFTGVEEWRFDQARNLGATTIVFEASWAQLGDLFYVTFDGVNVDSGAPTVEMFRASDTYIAAKPVEVTLRPIRRRFRTQQSLSYGRTRIGSSSPRGCCTR